ncbi:hypothetical protein BS329_15690 [Amycolatopsis coloradensis]|uniref:Uncharacterized protein n=1 Tax=Amycolatopsis coloradensis TaxID=76021 RepID=A0A1R0KUE2_9PSEU|nr:hypothetical protein [Amycolatopsis coloradensis]OLZ51705.1 hypothetical protein BS329_15690 [Amycolatopsis coloradensis]
MTSVDIETKTVLACPTRPTMTPLDSDIAPKDRFLDLTEWGRLREAARCGPFTRSGAYRPGDYVTFSAVANCAATVQILEPQGGGTQYLYSDGRIESTRATLKDWRPATTAEIEHWRNDTPAHLPGSAEKNQFPADMPAPHRHTQRLLHAMRVAYEAVLHASLANLADGDEETMPAPLTLRDTHVAVETCGYVVESLSEIMATLRVAAGPDDQHVTIAGTEETRRELRSLLGRFADLLTETDPASGPHADPRALR